MEAENQNGTDLQKASIPSYGAFSEFLNQIYWDGYAEQLAKDNPAGFQMEYNGFINAYNL